MNENNFNEKRLLGKRELCAYIGMGQSRGVEWAKGIGAAIRIGGRLLFDKCVIDKAINTHGEYTREGKKKGDMDHDC